MLKQNASSFSLNQTNGIKLHSFVCRKKLHQKIPNLFNLRFCRYVSDISVYRSNMPTSGQVLEKSEGVVCYCTGSFIEEGFGGDEGPSLSVHWEERLREGGSDRDVISWR